MRPIDENIGEIKYCEECGEELLVTQDEAYKYFDWSSSSPYLSPVKYPKYDITTGKLNMVTIKQCPYYKEKKSYIFFGGLLNQQSKHTYERFRLKDFNLNES